MTGEKGDTRGAYFHIAAEYENTTTGSGRAVGVLVPDDERIHLEKFTAEFFVRKNVDISFPSQVHAIQLYNSPSNTCAWQILFGSCSAGQTGPSQIYFQGNTRNGARAFSFEKTTPFTLFDGAWHHVAMTYDGAKCRFYSDYQLLGETACTIEYAENAADALLAIGNSSRTDWGRFHGFLDEVRISDEVLEPRQFLRSIPVLCDKDTLAYMPFDRVGAGRGDFGYYGMTNNLNAVFPLGAPKFPKKDSSGGTLETTLLVNPSLTPVDPVVTNEVPAGVIRNGFFDADGSVNTHAFHFLPENNRFFSILDHVDGNYHTVLTNDSYTFEWFFRRETGDEKSVTFINAYMQYKNGDGETKNPYLQVNLDGSSELSVTVPTTNLDSKCEHPSLGSYGNQLHPGWSEKSIGKVADDKWHHFAFVGEREKKLCHLYLDYQPVITFTNCVVLSERYVGSYVKGVTFGATYNSSANLRGFVDELRITRRALAPREFLSMYGSSELQQINGKNVLFYAPFDEDLKAYPVRDAFGASTTEGTVTRSATDLPELKDGTVPVREQLGLPPMTAQSLQSKGGRIKFDSPVGIQGLGAFTVEWYARLENPHTSQPFVRVEGVFPSKEDRQWPHSDNTGVLWQICGGGGAPDCILLSIANDYDAQPNAKLYFTAPKYRQNRWHHYALTCKKVVVDGQDKVEAHLFVDHQEAPVAWQGTHYLDVSELPLAPRGFMRVGCAGTWADLNGAFDEVRFTEGVLTTDEMMPPVAPRGLVLIVR